MRKILLATTALVAPALFGVAFAGAAHAAAPAPITLNVGGYNDFIAGYNYESPGTSPGIKRQDHSFEDEFKINFDALGKGSSGIEYGANVSLWNGPEITNYWTGGGNSVELNSAYVWMSGMFGKVLLGDEHGASDLFVYAPTVGEGQLDGRYQDFTSPFTLARVQPSGFDNTEHSTKITYYTPKIGNDANKVQVGVSYIPNMYNYGSNVTKFGTGSSLVSGLSPTAFNTESFSPYQDVVKAAAEFTGNWHPVHAAFSGQLETGSANSTAMGATNQGVGLAALGAAAGTYAGVQAMDYTGWGLGTQFGFDAIGGLTFGGSYTDLGHYGAIHGQNKDQNVWNAGVKYEFDKVGVAFSYTGAEMYDNMLLGSALGATSASPISSTNYVSSFDAYGLGATYTWFPGLTTGADAVYFNQAVQNQPDHNEGVVLLVSQKLTF